MEILSKNLYNEFETFCDGNENGAFQQSINWAKVKKEWNHEIVVSRNADKKIIGAVSILIRKIGPFSLLYSPRGPICNYTDREVIADLLKGIKEIAKKYNGYKYICDPLILASDCEAINSFVSCGFNFNKNSGFHDTIQPKYNYMLRYIKGLTPEELLKKFSSGTRYYIKFGPKNNVICKEGIEYLDDFYTIYQETGKRKKFTIRSKEYLKQILTAFPNNAKLFMCYHENMPLCGGLAIQFAKTTSHVYGCSTNEKRNLNPTYMLQWEMMKWAIEGDCHTYDMQGIAPDKDTDPELYNVYMFKSKFLGEVVETAGEFTVTFNKPVQSAIDLALKIREKIR